MEDAKRPSTSSQTVAIRPRLIYGLRTDVIGNINFNLSKEVIYPVEGVLAFHDYVLNKQRFLRFPEDTRPEIITMSSHRKLLAVLERHVKNGRYISIYELATLKKRRHLELPGNHRNTTVQQMIFTYDSRAIAVVTHPPDEMIFMLMLDKVGTVIEGRATVTGSHGGAECIAGNPSDCSFLAVGGKSTLLLMSKSDRGFTTSNNLKVNYHVTSMAFLSMDLLMVGTNQDMLILVENGEQKLKQKASEADTVDLLIDQEQFDRERNVQEPRFAIQQTPQHLPDKRVLCMTAFTKGFAFIMFNKMFVFERVSKFKYERKTILTVPVTIYAEPLYQITNIAIDHKQETVIVTTMHSQIYVGVLIVPETLKTKHLNFEPLGVLIHTGEVIALSVCAWKPILMTASKDQTIRIWNYETAQIELVRKFQVDVNIVELNSTGLMAAIGFSDQLRITQIFMDDLNIVKTYNFPHCNDVRYSNLGHLMAAAFNNNIAITSVYNLDLIINLKGHNGTVLSVSWTKTDKYLISGGAEGAIYQWDIETGSRLQEIVQKGTEYLTVCSSFSEPFSIYAGTNFGTIREFQDSELVREIHVPSHSKGPISDICLARSDLIMFVADHDGNLFNIQLPFLDAGGGMFTNFRFFDGQVNKLRFSCDGTLLMAISKSGTVSVWAMDNIDGKVAPIDQDLMKSQEVLIPRSQLNDKNQQITSLELRLKQQAEEFQYQLSQNEIFDGQQLAEVHRNYCAALEELKKLNNEIEQRHTEEMNLITFQINDMKEDHRHQLETLANQYSERMLIEYQKFTNLRESMLELRESYEEKLKKSTGTLQDTVEALENDYKKQLDERKDLIRELMKEMQDKKSEFIEYCHEVELENDRNMVETQTQYENKLTTERNETQMWRGKAGVLQKKYENQKQEIDNLLEEVEILKEEHQKSQRNIQKQIRNIEDLQKDISDRDYAISSKEKRIQDLLHKNQELDKYKQVLGHKIAELKAQIEPREFQINDKRKHIIEMENELEGLNQNNIQLELQLKEMRDKYLSNVAELRVERHRSKAARECLHSICTDIYYVAGEMTSPEGLRKAVKELFQKHASDDELKRFVSLDAEVRDEFLRQRKQIENVLARYKTAAEDKTVQKKYDKLFKENVTLLEEIEKLRDDNEGLRSRIKEDIKKVGHQKRLQMMSTISKN
ncbi:cilia- and flagella-associated protein 57 [Scaptodrosophila lebanonensis]|uniref:Cilia- and flagella-associated protein 57 n=1 Tax=Drosophila lebanonensis TaxID=7225 RepID=A0A6J2T771_DROLE|nr:cilia- and flagella-associated protein 57 [Scaptodrosophila lebanonensis]